MYEFQPVLDQKSLTCRLATGDDILLNCDAGKMQRVFDNLLRNAVNYSYDGTEITIAAEQNEDSVRLKFSNRGGTIPREKLERIFEQFYRLDTGRGSSGAGPRHRQADRHAPQGDDHGGEQGWPDGLYGGTTYLMPNNLNRWSRKWGVLTHKAITENQGARE